MNGLNEAWMLHVALKERAGSLPKIYLIEGTHIVQKFLGGGNWEDPQGTLTELDIARAEYLCAASLPSKSNKLKPGDLKPIADWFQISKGKKSFDGVYLSAAPMTGENPGCVYLKDGPSYGAAYLGKITPQGYFKGVELSASQIAALKTYADECAQAIAAMQANSGTQEVKSPNGYNVHVDLAMLGDTPEFFDVTAELKKKLTEKIAKGVKW